MNFSSIASSLSGWRGYALVAAIAFAAGGLAAAKVQGAIYEARIATIEKTHADEAADQARTALAEIVRLEAIIAGIDADFFQDLTHAKAENDKLRADIRTGALRLSVRTAACIRPGAGAAGMGDEGARAELDPKDADDLVAIAGEGDEAIIQLNACLAAYSAVRSAGATKEANGGK